ncbi:nucleotidyltransferase family protein [Candidatus Poribacteria bacterium]|nr:nucleotidyltransferase family protein [Candidatus Poribacteria bacterium]
MDAAIDLPMAEIEAFCRRHRIRRLALFGSVIRDDFTPDSDVDVLVEFEPGARVGLAFFSMQRELSEILGRNVDLNTPGFLSKYFRDEVLREAQVVFSMQQELSDILHRDAARCDPC